MTLTDPLSPTNSQAPFIQEFFSLPFQSLPIFLDLVQLLQLLSVPSATTDLWLFGRLSVQSRRTTLKRPIDTWGGGWVTIPSCAVTALAVFTVLRVSIQVTKALVRLIIKTYLIKGKLAQVVSFYLSLRGSVMLPPATHVTITMLGKNSSEVASLYHWNAGVTNTFRDNSFFSPK